MVKEATPPPVIAKAGRYTVFLTPPATPKTPDSSPRSNLSTPKSNLSPEKLSPSPPPLPPVQVPPQQFEKPTRGSGGGSFGFFWDAVAKVQSAHSSLDQCLAEWFGLNQSKYQWALNDYYEANGMDEEGKKPKEQVAKVSV